MDERTRLLWDWGARADAPAIADGDERWSFGELSARADAWCEALRTNGLRPGDRVAAWTSGRATAVAAMLGALRAGACWVPINRRYRAAERQHIVRDSGARWIVAEAATPSEGPPAEVPAGPTRIVLADGPQVVGEGAPAGPEAPQAASNLLIYTSGTTGPSKGVQLPPEAIVHGIGSLVSAWRFGPDDHLSLSLPLFHVHGLCIGVFGSLLSGTRITLHDKFDPAVVIDDFARDGATVFMGVPTMYVRLLEHLRANPSGAGKLAAARLFTAGSAALRPDVLDEFERRTGHRILERYGMTETLISLSNPYEGPRLAGHVGQPVAGYTVRVVDEDRGDVEDGDGELWVRGPGLMAGYWGLPEATASAFTDGWFRTGDVVARGPGGALRIVGRQSTDIIKSGGFKIATGEIEQALREHADVSDAAVVGLPDARWGESIAAAVELRPGAESRAWTDELAAFVGERLADYKRPRRVLVVDQLPRNALGKVVKPRLREWFSDRLADDGQT